MPVVAFYRRHGQGRATVDVRRIRQENIELLARTSITLSAKDFIDLKASKINLDADTVTINASELNINAETNAKGDINQVGNYFMTGNQLINGGQTINGNSTSYGNQTINGSVSATVDIKAAGVSVKSHTHGGVKSGGSDTSTPN